MRKRSLLYLVGFVLILGILILLFKGPSGFRSHPAPSRDEQNFVSGSSGTSGVPPSGQGQVQGRVMRQNNDEALAGAVVELTRETQTIYRAVTDTAGKYVIRGVTAGKYYLLARLHTKGILHRMGMLEIRTGELAERNIVIPVGPALSGRLIAFDRRPITAADFQIRSVDEPFQSEARICPVESDGRFRLLIEKARGLSRLVAVAEGYAPSKPVDVQLGEQDIDGLNLYVGGGGRVWGIVLNEDHQVVSSARVHLQPTQGSGLVPREAVCDDQGRFKFETVSPGDFQATVEADGYVVEPQADNVQVGEGLDTGPLIMRIRRGWSLTGQVIDSRHHPKADATILVYEGVDAHSARTGRDGRFVVQGITPEPIDGQSAPGIDLVNCRARGFVEVARQSVMPGDHLVLMMMTSGSLEVNMSLSDGSVPKNFSWSIRMSSRTSVEGIGHDAKSSRKKYTGRGDRRTIGGLVPGCYEVTVSAWDCQTVRKEPVYITSDETMSIHVVMVPGEPDIQDVIGLPLTLDDPVVFRSRFEAMLRALPPDKAQDIVDCHKLIWASLPKGDPMRKTLDEVLKDR